MPATSLLITDREMQSALDQGRARPLCPDIPEIRRYYGAWWITCPQGWLRITDTHIADRLNRIRMRLDVAEESAACRRAMQQDQPGPPG